MVKIFDGQSLAEKIKDKITFQIAKLDNKSSLDKGKPGLVGRRPNLAIVLVGERKDSRIYVDLKEKEAKKVGIDTHTYKCPVDISEREVFELIEHLNKDELIDAILVQLPLPKNFDTDGIIRAIDPAKDVDRFHPDNLDTLFKSCDHAHVIPPVFKAALEILNEIGEDLAGKQVCIIHKSDLFGKTLAKVLACRRAKVSLARREDKDLIEKTEQADVLISAVGEPGFIKKKMIKNGAVLIDIGITQEGGKVRGDMDFASVKDKAGHITPVPGGVGPVTIAMLFENTLYLYKQRLGK